MKLKDWADQVGVKYLTAYRWFKAGNLPVKAYQVGSGAIIVDDKLETPNQNNNDNDVMSLFLKKTVEFSKNESTVEDFAAYIISNFSLKLNTINESFPVYSKNKPKTEDVQKHFAKFIPEKDSIDHLKMIKSLIKDNPNGNSDGTAAKFLADDLREDLLEVFSDLDSDHVFSKAPSTPYQGVAAAAAEGVTARNVEFVSTPQQTNYTGSIAAATFGNNFSQSASLNLNDARLGTVTSSVIPAAASSSFYSNTVAPLTVASVIDSNVPKRRGRKPSKKSGNTP